MGPPKLIAASHDKFLQFLAVHPLDPRHDPASEWKRVSVHMINMLPARRYICITHTARPLENLGTTGISAPFSSSGFKIVNAAKTLAITNHTDVSAKCLPTQMRRPNPNMTSPSLGFRDPSSLRNRSGRNAHGFGYLDSSCVIDLAKQVSSIRLEGSRVYITNHRFAITMAPSEIN